MIIKPKGNLIFLLTFNFLL